MSVRHGVIHLTLSSLRLFSKCQLHFIVLFQKIYSKVSTTITQTSASRQNHLVRIHSRWGTGVARITVFFHTDLNARQRVATAGDISASVENALVSSAFHTTVCAPYHDDHAHSFTYILSIQDEKTWNENFSAALFAHFGTPDQATQRQT